MCDGTRYAVIENVVRVADDAVMQYAHRRAVARWVLDVRQRMGDPAQLRKGKREYEQQPEYGDSHRCLVRYPYRIDDAVMQVVPRVPEHRKPPRH